MSQKITQKDLDKVTQNNLDEFKKLVRRAIFISSEEEETFKLIPDSTWKKIFIKNFDGNFEFSRRVLLGSFKEIEKIDNKVTEKEKNKIFNLNKAVSFVTDSIEKKIPIVYITDFDNDGSLAQSIINEYLEIDKEAAKNMRVEYAQTVNGNSSRGFTVDHVDLIVSASDNIKNNSSEFLIITADNGINSKDEQMKILKKYPKAKIVITDHHNPDPIMVAEDNERTVIFNPHYKPTEFFKKFNISGANTVGVLLLNVLSKRFTEIELMTYQKSFEKITNLCKISNLLDYVDTHPADKPEKDYIITKFLRLQPLMNINNSISKIITGEISESAIAALDKKIPKLNVSLIHEEAKNIHVQNHVAKVLLHLYKTYKNDPETNKMEFNSVFLKELISKTHYEDHSNINPNYIEQLRPLIFGLNADNEKNKFMDLLANKMEDIYESIKSSEKKMAQELRRGEVITKQKLPNSIFAYADPNILTVFNRKFLNKVYNDENPGFSVTLDSIGKEKVSGSFRSLYDISDILKNKKKLEKSLGITIETPGHERAAGFIIRSKDPKKNPITEDIIGAINEHINLSIQNIKEQEIKNDTTYLLSDFNSIKLIDKINFTIRGNVSNFEKVNTLIKLTKDTVWTDSYTTEQYTMEDISKKKSYGYITVNMDFHGGTVIVPVELVKRIVDSEYKDYLSLGYMDGGVFMVDRVMKNEDVKSVIDLRKDNKKTESLRKAFELDFKDKSMVSLNRSQIQDNPFFKYNDYGKLNFDLFERMVIGIIDSNKVDILSVFDVEANGFANAKIMNIGATNYSINPKSGQKMDAEYFFDRYYITQRGEEYILTSDQVSGLRQITREEYEGLNLDVKKNLLIKRSSLDDDTETYVYFLHEDLEKATKSKKGIGFTQVKNYIENEDGSVTYNREIEATMSAYLMKEKDFKVPQEMINLTGITQDLIDEFGKSTDYVDEDMSKYYEGKKVLFGAHNIPYDAKILRANMPKMYDVLRDNVIYDSALFSREKKLAYDDVSVSYFEGVDGLPKNVYFYSNDNSDFNLRKFIDDDRNGYYPDRTNRYLLEIENSQYYLVDKVEHEKIKLDAQKEDLLLRMNTNTMPANSIKYSVEKLSEQWMIHSLLLCNENFDIKHVDLNNPVFANLKKHEEALRFFQDNYHFDIDKNSNKFDFQQYYPDIIAESTPENPVFDTFIAQFLSLNKDIQQKFSDSWMYKAVLGIKDPTKAEVTNDLIDLVYYQTQIPKDKIKNIFKDAIEFKEKYKVDHVLQHEMHANGPWRTDAKGDVAFEDKLTLTLLAQRRYNSYDHSVRPAVVDFNMSKIKARMAFDVADNLSSDVAQDSYSFRQGILYDREAVTPLISTIKEKEDKLGQKDMTQLVKFKLDDDVLPQDGFVYGLIKEDKTLTRELIEDHKKKLSFIMLNEQLKSSLHNIDSTEDKAALKEVIDENLDKILEIKKELSEYYFYIEYNRKDYQMKEYIDKAKDFVEGNKSISKKTKFPSTDDVDINGLNIVRDVLTHYYEQVVDVNASDMKNGIESLKEFINILDSRIENHTATKMEYYKTFPNAEIKQTFDENGQPNVQEENFLFNVSILRQDPMDRVVNKHTQYKLLNSLIEKSQEFYSNKSTNKKSRQPS